MNNLNSQGLYLVANEHLEQQTIFSNLISDDQNEVPIESVAPQAGKEDTCPSKMS